MALTAALAPATLTGSPGHAVGCDVVLVNHGADGEAVDLDVAGPAGAWVMVWPARLALPPGGEGRARLTFTIPQVPPATMSFAVRATGSTGVEAQGSVEIAAVADLRLVVRPMMARARRTSRHTVTVENRGNVAVRADIAAVPSDGVVVELSGRSVSVAPDQEASLTLVVAARRWSLARTTRTHRLSVAATTDAGTATRGAAAGAPPNAGAGVRPASAEVVLFQEPLRWRLPALAAVALLVVALLVWPSGGGRTEAAGDLVATDRAPAGQGSDALISPAADPAPSCPAPAGGEMRTVAIATFAFCPSPIKVAAGTEVAWRNDDAAPHTVTSSPAGAFDSGILTYGQSFRARLEAPGAYDYVCALHPGMRGTIVVTG